MPDIRSSLQQLANAISPETGTNDGIVDTIETSIERISAALPQKLGGVPVTAAAASASINNAGLITFKNSDGATLFTLQLPLYNETVSGGSS